MNIEIFFSKNPEKNKQACMDCEPAKIISEVFRNGGFQNWKPDRKISGDSYETGYDLMVDLTRQGVAKDFSIVSGTLQDGKYVHCWLEFGDWVVDFSNGKQRIYGKKFYYEQGKVDKKRLKTLTASQWRRKVEKLASEEEVSVKQTLQAIHSDPTKSGEESEE